MGNDIDTNKIEERAIGVLERIIDDHPTMESKIVHGEKGMSWDGSITIYKPGCTRRTKETYDYNIPVQIKGRTDGVSKYLDEITISYSISVRDLKLYYEQTGCLYFIVFLDDTTKRGEIFYASLFPSKIKGYLDRNGKECQSQIPIRFTHLKKDADELYCVLAQYGKEMVRQGFGRGPVVSNMISADDIFSVDVLSATVVGAKDELDFVRKMNSGNVCLYSKKHNIDIPIESDESVRIFMGRDNIHLPIKVDDTEYYSKYNAVINPDGGIVVKPSENVAIQISEGKISFRPCSNISQISNDIEFLLALEKAGKMSIERLTIPFVNIVYSEGFKDQITYIKKLCDVVAEIGIKITKPFSDFSESDLRQLGLLVNIKAGRLNEIFDQASSVYNWSFDNKFYPILVEKQPQGNMLFPLTTNSRIQIFVGDGKTKQYKYPTFCVLDADVLAKLYYFDNTWFEEQIDLADVDPNTTGDLNNAALKLISVYDLSANREFLNLAKRLYSRLKADELYYLINMLQIKVRETGLTDSDINRLNSIETNEIPVMFCRSVLLGEKKDAHDYYQKLSNEEKATIKGLPIMKLYSDM